MKKQIIVSTLIINVLMVVFFALPIMMISPTSKSLRIYGTSTFYRDITAEIRDTTNLDVIETDLELAKQFLEEHNGDSEFLIQINESISDLELLKNTQSSNENYFTEFSKYESLLENRKFMRPDTMMIAISKSVGAGKWYSSLTLVILAWTAIIVVDIILFFVIIGLLFDLKEVVISFKKEQTATLKSVEA